jgi:hypothetical protein
MRPPPNPPFCKNTKTKLPRLMANTPKTASAAKFDFAPAQ